MNNLYVYDVGGIEFEDTTPWGQAWKDAKALAEELHAGIYRTVINMVTEAERREVFCNGGVFLDISYVTTPDRVKIF